MKFSFKQKYLFPVSMESAVVTYLDCEHYIFLHATCETKYQIINLENNKCISEVHYKSGIFKWKQISTTEYISPSTLKQYDVKIKGFGYSILANLLNVRTTLKYYYNNRSCRLFNIKNKQFEFLTPDNKTLISEILYEIDLPFYLYPFKFFLKKNLEKMKINKDIEDLDFIERRIKLFGNDNVNAKSGYWAPYFRKNYFILFKEQFINNFFKTNL